MKLRVDHVDETFIPIKQFREMYHLDSTFGVACFEPKDYRGLGSLDGAGESIKRLRQIVLQSIPDQIQLTHMIDIVDQLQLSFQDALNANNHVIGLRDAEVDFAVAGFGDVLHAMIYKMIPQFTAKQGMPSFESVYMNWIDDSVRVSSHVHSYNVDSDVWQVRIVTQVYGRVGLQVKIGDLTQYVADGVYMCPAEGFMFTLLRDVTGRLWEALHRKVG